MIEKKKIVIAGAGASGMMAAAAAARALGEGGDVLLLEKNERAGRKLLATGNGRCNFTNTKCTSWDFSGAFLSRKETSGFPDGVMYQASPKSIMELFFQMGILPREEEEGQVYPYSGQGASICQALLFELSRLSVEIRYQSVLRKVEALPWSAVRDSSQGCLPPVEEDALPRTQAETPGAGGVQTQAKTLGAVGAQAQAEALGTDGGRLGSAGPGGEGATCCPNDSKGFRLTLADGSQLFCDRLILAVGGKAGCQYGSEGDGYAVARELGHTVIKPIPALVQLMTDDRAFSQLKGVRAKARATLFEGEEKLEEDRGEVQFTENGLSGICIFNLSRSVRYEKNPMEGGKQYHVRLDFIDDYSVEMVLAFLKIRQNNIGERRSANFLDGVLHEKLSAVFMRRAGIPPEKRAADFTEDQLIFLARMLKGFDVRITGTRSWRDAQVTAGGVDTGEINRRTLESRLLPGLYFTGELIDVDGPCGGYNLQWAFASGLVGGRAAARSLAGQADEGLAGPGGRRMVNSEADAAEKWRRI